MVTRLHRRCPHCKSTQGFSLTVYLGGTECKQVGFNGKVINVDRSGTDDIEKYASCLNCGKMIPTDKLDIKNV